jgi:hypothetical protein
MVHKIEKLPEKRWIVWTGNLISEEAGWTPEQIAKMVKEGTISFEHYKPDFIKVTDAKDSQTFVSEEYGS